MVRGVLTTCLVDKNETKGETISGLFVLLCYLVGGVIPCHHVEGSGGVIPCHHVEGSGGVIPCHHVEGSGGVIPATMLKEALKLQKLTNKQQQ